MMTMRSLKFFTFLVLLTSIVISCTATLPITPTAPATTILPTAAPTYTPTPNPEPEEGLINPGDRIGDMVLTIGQGEGVTEIWEYCDPYITETGVIAKECKVPALQSLFIGYGSYADTTEELDVDWPSITWELFLDDQQVNLPAFGTFDKDDDMGGPVKLRSWNVMLEQASPGKHTLHYTISQNGETYDITWAFTVASPATVEIPAGAASFPFVGKSSAFSTLAEFNNFMKSTASGKVDDFWQVVTATGQMPLIFGDEIAVFLYRGQAEKVACQGDFIAEYTRQGETDLWAFMKQLEPDARLEYQIVVDSNTFLLDPLNPFTETGGFGTKSVVRMPAYVVPEFTLAREGIVHGTLSENFTFSSQSLGYTLNYRVYTPISYETSENLPVLYVTDGQDFANPGMGALVNVLDSLIADGRIKPIIAVLVDPRDPITGYNRREEELVPDSLASCPFCDFVALELVPTIDAAYKTDPSPDARALLGFSLGGMFTAHMGLAYPDVFHLIAIQSPYISGNWILETYQEGGQLPLKVFLSHGSYDERASSIRLRDILDAKGYPLLYIETHEGHSYGNVRGVLDDLLISFFSSK